ncbi:hypothetical protein A2803_03930 [Candidatus Woesebacteria bacterium RIFCSPHIGHO2_01_FULL_44_21]|uniref:Uncharacterized protein n=1 Tax=Candidatus Woesebacteria bacterium RIFCSPHIGHO2_01_FULL_44_21 TaxID=1802503 RepID=A0A1F7YVX2_9BACT|nr:MAG: hypothetical protein A2803_03930 [Candidatus Woesebacteria bacterium RIFCSPHIGHO2_01_FULL_44_21]
MKSKKEIVFKNYIPPKNKLILAILFARFPLLIPGISWVIKKHLRYCKNIKFIPGFRYLYGNIHASDAVLNDTFFMDYAHVYIGKGTKFSLENMVITSTHDPQNFNIVRAKPITIGKNVWITTRCIILGGVTIGDNSVIGAGSVVTSDIPPKSFAAGNPCKVVKKI